MARKSTGKAVQGGKSQKPPPKQKAEVGRGTGVAFRVLRRGREWLLRGARLLTELSPAITTVATVVLAVTTWLYLEEVRAEREIAHYQLALDATPEIEIFTPAPLVIEQGISGAPVRASVAMQNYSGVAVDVNLGMIIFCCADVEDLVDGEVPGDDLLMYTRGSAAPRIGKDRKFTTFMGIAGQDRDRVAQAFEGPHSRITALVRVDYTRPATFLDPHPLRSADHKGFWWNPVFKTWMHLSEEGTDALKSLAADAGKLETLEKELEEVNGARPES